MRRILATLVLISACRQGGGDIALAPPPVPAYAAPLAPWPPAPVSGAIGRAAAPAQAQAASIEWGLAIAPIDVDRVWAVPDAGEALAVVSGTVGDQRAIELIGVDDGRVRWRASVACPGPVVHVTSARIVCADAVRLYGVDVANGQLRWSQPGTFTGAEGDLVVAAHGSEVEVVSAGSGTVVVETAPPAGIEADVVKRACQTPDGIELWAWGGAGVARFAPGGAPDTIAVEREPSRIDACGAPPLIELPIPGSIERRLTTLGAPTIVTERGWWRGAGDHVIVATAQGIVELDATLAPVKLISDAQVGREITSRGKRRLVRGVGGAPILLEDERPVAQLSAPARVDSAVLGDQFLIGGGWQSPASSFADHVDRWRLPDATTAIAPLVVGDPPDPFVEARDLPAPIDLASAPSIDLAGVGAHDVELATIDPLDGATLYVAPLERQPDRVHGAGLAAFDLRTRSWRWHVAAGCGAGSPVALAVARDVIVCGSHGALAGAGVVRAVRKTDGVTQWSWHGATVDAIVAAGGLVAVTVGREAILLDAATGVLVGKVAADDGFAPRLAVVDLDGIDAIVMVERGAVVARIPRAAMLPLWAVAIHGVATAMSTAGGKVAIELASGEAYLLEPATGRAVAAAGWGRRWQVAGDLVLGGPAVPQGLEWPLDAYGVDGTPRFAATYALEPPWLVGARGTDPAAPLPLAHGPAARSVAVVDPASGQVRAIATLPRRTVPGEVFATAVDGHALVGAVLSQPLGIVLLPP